MVIDEHVFPIQVTKTALKRVSSLKAEGERDMTALGHGERCLDSLSSSFILRHNPCQWEWRRSVDTGEPFRVIVIEKSNRRPESAYPTQFSAASESEIRGMSLTFYTTGSESANGRI